MAHEQPLGAPPHQDQEYADVHVSPTGTSASPNCHIAVPEMMDSSSSLSTSISLGQTPNGGTVFTDEIMKAHRRLQERDTEEKYCSGQYGTTAPVACRSTYAYQYQLVRRNVASTFPLRAQPLHLWWEWQDELLPQWCSARPTGADPLRA